MEVEVVDGNGEDKHEKNIFWFVQCFHSLKFVTDIFWSNY